MPGIKELKTRIKSIGSTRKITRAMQLVSAAKMRKAQNATVTSRTYSSMAWEVIKNLSATENARAYQSPLLSSHPNATKVLILALSSNRGFVGGLNANLLAALDRQITEKSLDAVLIVYGKKAREYSVRRGKNILADFEKQDRTIATEDIYPISKMITDSYSSGKYKEVVIVYNHYISTIAQKPTFKRLLPFSSAEIGIPKNSSSNAAAEASGGSAVSEYVFEPNPQAVFEHLLPRIIESQIYQAILESEASEQSARMVMMKNATEAAEDLIGDLTLTFNKLRQSKITTELAEITAGRIALE